MLLSIVVICALSGALGQRLSSSTGLRLITPRPYNNRYSDATAARDGHFI